MNEYDTLLEAFKESVLNVNAHYYWKQFLTDIDSNAGYTATIKKVYELLDNEVLKNKHNSPFLIQINPGEIYYRARIIPVSDYKKSEKGIGIYSNGLFRGYNEDNSREPQLGISSSGRNNISGESYLYLASNPETACTEVRPHLGELISLATFRVISPLQIVDFSSDNVLSNQSSNDYNLSTGEFFSNLMFEFSKPATQESQYKPTQIIADHIRKFGFDGLKYRSFLSPGGYNYTIFNCHPSNIEFCDSKILIYKQANHSYWDLNEECEIMSNPNGELLKYNKKIADEARKQLKKVISPVKEQ